MVKQTRNNEVLTAELESTRQRLDLLQRQLLVRAVYFPLIAVLVPVRLYVLPRIFGEASVDAMDAEGDAPDAEDEARDGPDDEGGPVPDAALILELDSAEGEK